MRPCLYEERLPHFTAGIRTQQFTTKAANIMTCVQYSVRNKFVLALISDQSRDRFKNPMPPKPEPRKLAVAFSGATQHKKARDPSIGKTYSGRNCQRITPTRTEKKTFICLLDLAEGCVRSFFCVSKSAVWQSLDGKFSSK